METETGGNFEARGKSGEVGAFQFLPSTFAQWGREVLGYTPTLTPATERYVALKMIQKWIDQGLSARQIAWKWNSGRHDKCIEGVNKHNVEYSSCKYAENVLVAISQ